MKKKMFKIAGIVLSLICGILTVSFVNHRIRLKAEKKLLNPLGKLVEVDGANMSIYTEGEGENTLVFMSGGGTCSPILDFKSLYSLLTNDYQIAVVEKFGYGFSDITNKSRDIDTILENTRSALQSAGIKPPYTLCPHSMSGIEALYWAQKYPGEISAIIGLDMSVPQTYEELKINVPILRLAQFGAAAGITRFTNFSEGAAIQSGTLTEEEKKIYRALFYSRTLTDDMLNEVSNIKESAEKVGGRDLPQIPILMFCSDGSGGTGFTEEKWRKIQSDFAKSCGADIIYLDCGHYVHDYEYEKIAKETKNFLNQ